MSFGNRVALSNRAILAAIQFQLSEAKMGWVEGVAMFNDSDQASETYGWLGDIPGMKLKRGGFQRQRLQAFTYAIVNDKYESTIEVTGDEKRRDKTGQVATRIGQVGIANTRHWASLFSTLMLNGASSLCYDGQYFYDTDHTDGLNTTSQSNKISVDISTLPTQAHGSTTAPSAEEMQQTIMQGISALLGFKSDTGELINEDASAFLVQVPTSLYAVACAAVGAVAFAGGGTNIMASSGSIMQWTVQVRANGRFTWTDTFTITRTDTPMKAFVGQEEFTETVEIGFESEQFKKEDYATFGIWSSRAAGYGLWQMSVQMIMI